VGPFRTGAKILLIQGDLSLQKSLSFILEKEGFIVLAARTGEEGIALARKETPEILLIDPALPGIDGAKVCQILRKDSPTARIYVILLSDSAKVEDVAQCLRDYADDYVVKPFEPRILIARLHALLRRKAKAEDGTPGAKDFDGLTIRPEAYEVQVDGRNVGFTKTEFDILTLLAGKPSQVFTRSRILDHVREDNYSITERVVDYQIAGIRKKLGRARSYIQTVRGVGYKFKPESES
jgi:two-component system alkaline phosphatase synthesis response regulator PhoP